MHVDGDANKDDDIGVGGDVSPVKIDFDAVIIVI